MFIRKERKTKSITFFIHYMNNRFDVRVENKKSYQKTCYTYEYLRPSKIGHKIVFIYWM